MPWSKLSSKEYNDIQDCKKGNIKEKNPIERESNIMMKYAEKKKQLEKG